MMFERKVIYEIHYAGRRIQFLIHPDELEEAIRELTLEDIAPTVREAEVECEIRAGEILGVLDGSETCHLVFQKPCGEWSSEDVDEKTAYADEFILHCSCRKCIDKYFIVRPPRRSPPSSDSLA
jgi:hypothetical protein